jgi:hypothetical protein
MSAATTREEEEVGLMFYLLSKDLQQPLFDGGAELGPEQSAAGWKYFGTLSDSSGGMNLTQFQGQMQKVFARFIQQSRTEEGLASFIKGNLGDVIKSVQDIDVKIKRTTSKLVEKLLDSTPVFATAIFRLFGEMTSFPCFAIYCRWFNGG